MRAARRADARGREEPAHAERAAQVGAERPQHRAERRNAAALLAAALALAAARARARRRRADARGSRRPPSGAAACGTAA